MKTVLPGQGFRFELDGRSLTIEDVVAFSRRSEYASCALSAEAVEKITATRALKRDLIGREVPIYGVTTGFGDSAHRQISASKTARLQRNGPDYLAGSYEGSDAPARQLPRQGQLRCSPRIGGAPPVLPEQRFTPSHP